MFKNDFFNNNHILDTFIPKDVYNNEELYCSDNDNDLYSFYPNVYKKIGQYLYINFLNNNNCDTISANCLKTWSEDVFRFLNSTQKYKEEEYEILKQLIQIVILDEIDRNNYKIS